MITKRTRFIFLLALATVLGSAVLFTFLIFNINNRDSELVEKQIEAKRAEVLTNELSALVRLVEETQGEREELNEYILTDDQVIDFLALLEATANQQGLNHSIDSLSVAPVNDTFEELSVRMTARGDQGTVEHVLKVLETLPYQSFVSETTLTRNEDESGVSTWEGIFLLRVTKYVGV